MPAGWHRGLAPACAELFDPCGRLEKGAPKAFLAPQALRDAALAAPELFNRDADSVDGRPTDEIVLKKALEMVYTMHSTEFISYIIYPFKFQIFINIPSKVIQSDPLLSRHV